ncbi:MAG: chemotaxis protein CheX [Ignavibacteriota bacterium]
MSDAATRVHREDLESVVGSVFSTMMGLDVWPCDEPCPAASGMMTAAVYLTGAWTGAACIHVEPRQACDFTGHFLGTPTPDAISDDVRDVMGEIANMIAGNLKCTLAPGIRVSIPSVTDGPGYSLRVCGAHVVCRASFDTNSGPFWISLVDVGEQQ